MTSDQREAAVATLLPIVHLIARRVARICRVRDPDDLIGDGSLGLLRAIDTFDAGRGVSLERYARHVVLGAILNGLRHRDPVSERARRRVRIAERLRRELQARGCAPTERELEAAVAGLRRARAQVDCGLPLSLDMALPIGIAVRPDWSGDPARVYAREAGMRTVRLAIDSLPARQQEIVRDHYFRDVPLRVLSQKMAVTPQRVSQLHCAALARLRAAVAAEW